MVEPKQIVVIGGTACGPKAAARARRCDPSAKITLIEQEENLSVATCGLPYYVSGVIENQNALLTRKPDFFRDVLDLEVLTRTRALAIDRKAHEVKLVNLQNRQAGILAYDKLVLAMGSLPVVPDFGGRLPGGVFTMTKIADAFALERLVSSQDMKKVVIVGAGLIGMEMAEAFVRRNLDVTVVEVMDRVLPTFLDIEMSAQVARHLEENGVKLRLGQRVVGFAGDKKGWVRKVLTEHSELEAGLVLMALGVKPNRQLAQDAGLTIGMTGGIAVDNFLRTSDPDIYAGGDCVENVDLITGRKVLAPLGSTANKHGRVIGSNVTGGQETFPGIAGTAIAKVFEDNVARVGLGEAQARESFGEVMTCLVPGDEHATYYPGSREFLVKLIAARGSGKLLGGQVVGLGDVAKRIDVLATALTFGATIDDLANIDLAYAPPFNSAFDPLHHAANVLRNKRSGFARGVTFMEVKSKIENGDDFILLDVRNPAEWQERRIAAPQVKLLPLGELRRRLAELPKDKEIITLCRRSVRAYQAQRILDGAGFPNVKFMDGSITAWPYETASG